MQKKKKKTSLYKKDSNVATGNGETIRVQKKEKIVTITLVSGFRNAAYKVVLLQENMRQTS